MYLFIGTLLFKSREKLKLKKSYVLVQWYIPFEVINEGTAKMVINAVSYLKVVKYFITII